MQRMGAEVWRTELWERGGRTNRRAAAGGRGGEEASESARSAGDPIGSSVARSRSQQPFRPSRRPPTPRIETDATDSAFSNTAPPAAVPLPLAPSPFRSAATPLGRARRRPQQREPGTTVARPRVVRRERAGERPGRIRPAMTHAHAGADPARTAAETCQCRMGLGPLRPRPQVAAASQSGKLRARRVSRRARRTRDRRRTQRPDGWAVRFRLRAVCTHASRIASARLCLPVRDGSARAFRAGESTQHVF